MRGLFVVVALVACSMLFVAVQCSGTEDLADELLAPVNELDAEEDRRLEQDREPQEGVIDHYAASNDQHPGFDASELENTLLEEDGEDDDGEEGDDEGEGDYDDEEDDETGADALDFTYDYYMNLDLLRKCKMALRQECAASRGDLVSFIRCLRAHASTLEEVCAKNIGCLTVEAETCGVDNMLATDFVQWAKCVETNASTLRPRCPPTLDCEVKTAQLCGPSIAESSEKGQACTKANKDALEQVCGMEDAAVEHEERIDPFEVFRSTASLSVDCRKEIQTLCSDAKDLGPCIELNAHELQAACSRNSTCLAREYSVCGLGATPTEHGVCQQEKKGELEGLCGQTLQCESGVLRTCPDLSEPGLAECYEKNEAALSSDCTVFADFLGINMPDLGGDAFDDNESLQELDDQAEMSPEGAPSRHEEYKGSHYDLIQQELAKAKAKEEEEAKAKEVEEAKAKKEEEAKAKEEEEAKRHKEGKDKKDEL